MFINILFVAFGGAIGASLRFFVSVFFKNYFPFFPFGTLLVNVIGSLIIGVLFSYLHSKEISETIYKYFLIIGVLGSFTTFSAFSLETVEFMKDGKIFLSLLYVFLSICLTISATYVGILMKNYLF